ncbi:MAG TPA: S26 family signal peptidase, partial [Herpetosiphonaceae bacterium]
MSSTPLNDRLDQLKGDEDRLRPVRLEPAPPPPDPADDPIDVDVELAAEATVARRKPRAVIKELLETVVFVLLVFFIVRGLLQNFKIEGLSMFPTMKDSQYILVNKAVYFHFDVNAPLRLLPGRSELPGKVVYPFHTPQ